MKFFNDEWKSGFNFEKGRKAVEIDETAVDSGNMAIVLNNMVADGNGKHDCCVGHYACWMKVCSGYYIFQI